MFDTALLTEAIKRMVAGGPAGRLVLHVDGEAVGELGAVVGQDGINLVREVGQEALQEGGCRLAVPSGMDLDIDVAGSAIDRDKGIALVALQGRQMLQIDVDKPILAVSKMPTFGLSGLGRALIPWRCRQRWMALRDSSALTHRCITSTMSSSGNCSDVRSSQTSRLRSPTDWSARSLAYAAGRPRCCGRANDGSWSR